MKRPKTIDLIVYCVIDAWKIHELSSDSIHKASDSKEPHQYNRLIGALFNRIVLSIQFDMFNQIFGGDFSISNYCLSILINTWCSKWQQLITETYMFVSKNYSDNNSTSKKNMFHEITNTHSNKRWWDKQTNMCLFILPEQIHQFN